MSFQQFRNTERLLSHLYACYCPMYFQVSTQLILTENLKDKYYSRLTGKKLSGLGQRTTIILVDLMAEGRL